MFCVRNVKMVVGSMCSFRKLNKTVMLVVLMSDIPASNACRLAITDKTLSLSAKLFNCIVHLESLWHKMLCFVDVLHFIYKREDFILNKRRVAEIRENGVVHITSFADISIVHYIIQCCTIIVSKLYLLHILRFWTGAVREARQIYKAMFSNPDARGPLPCTF